eukprot:6260856-Pyramimonas_sp.AAC.1
MARGGGIRRDSGPPRKSGPRTPRTRETEQPKTRCIGERGGDMGAPSTLRNSIGTACCNPDVASTSALGSAFSTVLDACSENSAQ